LESPEGKNFDRRLAIHAEEAYSPLIEKCVLADVHHDLRSFESVFRLNKNGKVIEIYAWPETAVALCFNAAAKHVSHPKPPRDNYWVLTEMRMQ
jgi:hypothetical protein